MKNSVLYNSVNSSIYFIFGFIVGTILDNFIYELYLKIDSNEDNLFLLFLIVITQLSLLSFIFNYTYIHIKTEINNILFRYGLLSSTIYMITYSMARIKYRFIKKKPMGKVDSSSVTLLRLANTGF